MRHATLIFAAAMLSVSAVSAHAKEKTYAFDITPGSCADPIAVPISKPLIVSGGNTLESNRGAGQVTIIRSGIVLTWVGVDLARGLEGGGSQMANAHILSLDNASQVELRTADSAHIAICNSSTNPANATGHVTLVY